MKYVYPAVFHPFEDGSNGYMVTFPDIPGCLTEGFSLEEAISMAHSALREMMTYYEDHGLQPDNPPSNIRDLDIEWDKGQFPSMVSVNTRDDRTVIKTISLPQRKAVQPDMTRPSRPTGPEVDWSFPFDIFDGSTIWKDIKEDYERPFSLDELMKGLTEHRHKHGS